MYVYHECVSYSGVEGVYLQSLSGAGMPQLTRVCGHPAGYRGMLSYSGVEGCTYSH